jgi:hypothetical protein
MTRNEIIGIVSAAAVGGALLSGVVVFAAMSGKERVVERIIERPIERVAAPVQEFQNSDPRCSGMAEVYKWSSVMNRCVYVPPKETAAAPGMLPPDQERRLKELLDKKRRLEAFGSER